MFTQDNKEKSVKFLNLIINLKTLDIYHKIEIKNI